ncbi:MAG: preprotein translocase subunit SecE [Clostridia bacterium]|nr:preprotein translocase subunit SecE [Clostridia bacterium]
MKPSKDKVSFGKKVAKFFKDYKSELKKVTWASKEIVVKHTSVVVSLVVVSMVILVVLDFAFNMGITSLGKLI